MSDKSFIQRAGEPSSVGSSDSCRVSAWTAAQGSQKAYDGGRYSL